MIDYYQVLGVSAQASAEEIKAAYKRLALRYHPDRNQGSTEAEERFKLINEAYQILSDAGKKQRYDYLRAYGAPPNVEPTAQPRYRHPSDARRRTYTTGSYRRTTYKASAPMPPPKEELRKLYTYIALASVAFVGLVFFLTWYMQHVSLGQHVEDAQKFYRDGRFTEAIYSLNSALLIDNEHVEANFLMGRIQEQAQTNNYKAALHYFSRAIAFAPAYQEQHYLARARLLQQNKVYTDALPDLQQILRQNPGHKAATALMADNLLYGQRDYKQARVYYRKLIAADTLPAESYIGLAVSYLQSTQYDSASIALQTADTFGASPATWGVSDYYRGLMALQQQDTAAACAFWQKAARFNIKEANQQITLNCQ